HAVLPQQRDRLLRQGAGGAPARRPPPAPEARRAPDGDRQLPRPPAVPPRGAARGAPPGPALQARRRAQKAADPDLGVHAMTGKAPRLRPALWSAPVPKCRRRLALRALVLLIAVAALFYFTWLLQPERIGQPVLYVLLVAAEVFNVVQAAGFWWT